MSYEAYCLFCQGGGASLGIRTRKIDAERLATSHIEHYGHHNVRVRPIHKNPIAIFNRPRKAQQSIRRIPIRSRDRYPPVPWARTRTRNVVLDNGRTLIYGRVIEIRCQKTRHPKWKGHYFKHRFQGKSHVELFGLPNGALLIQSRTGEKLWSPE